MDRLFALHGSFGQIHTRRGARNSCGRWVEVMIPDTGDGGGPRLTSDQRRVPAPSCWTKLHWKPRKKDIIDRLPLPPLMLNRKISHSSKAVIEFPSYTHCPRPWAFAPLLLMVS